MLSYTAIASLGVRYALWSFVFADADLAALGCHVHLVLRVEGLDGHESVDEIAILSPAADAG